MVAKRKFNTELTDEDIFYFKEEDFKDFDWNEITWDWHFEKNAYYVKKDTIKELDEIINIAVKNRGIVEHVYFCCTVDFPNIGIKLDRGLIYFYQSLYSRMIKTSKVIQDLAIQGSYIEAKSLLRNNFERAVFIHYFTKNKEKLQEFMESKIKQDIKIINKYSIRNLVKEINKDYETYKILCNFSHPNFYEEDVSHFEFNDEQWLSMKSYNSFDYKDFFGIMLWNNNLLVETFDVMMNYLMKDFPKEKLDESIKKVLGETKDLKMILVKEKNGKKKEK